MCGAYRLCVSNQKRVGLKAFSNGLLYASLISSFGNGGNAGGLAIRGGAASSGALVSYVMGGFDGKADAGRLVGTGAFGPFAALFLRQILKGAVMTV